MSLILFVFEKSDVFKSNMIQAVSVESVKENKCAFFLVYLHNFSTDKTNDEMSRGCVMENKK